MALANHDAHTNSFAREQKLSSAMGLEKSQAKIYKIHFETVYALQSVLAIQICNTSHTSPFPNDRGTALSVKSVKPK